MTDVALDHPSLPYGLAAHAIGALLYLSGLCCCWRCGR